MLKDRDEHLNKVLGITEEEPSDDSDTKELKEIALNISEKRKSIIKKELLPDEFNFSNEDSVIMKRKQLSQNKADLEELYDVSKDVLFSFSDYAKDMGRGGDIRAFSELVKSMTDLQKNMVEVNEKIYNKDVDTKADSINNGTVNNNNIFVGEASEINKILGNTDADD